MSIILMLVKLDKNGSQADPLKTDNPLSVAAIILSSNNLTLRTKLDGSPLLAV